LSLLSSHLCPLRGFLLSTLNSLNPRCLLLRRDLRRFSPGRSLFFSLLTHLLLLAQLLLLSGVLARLAPRPCLPLNCRRGLLPLLGLALLLQLLLLSLTLLRGGHACLLLTLCPPLLLHLLPQLFLLRLLLGD
jgi:hypothetical protein